LVLQMSGLIVLAERYRLDHPLGSGGMGTVWRGQDLRLNRAVAIKQAAGHDGGSAGARRRLRREAAALGGLCEARIARVYDFLDTDDGAFIVMELVDGESLSARLKRERRLPAAEAVRIAEDCARALHAAHRAGVVHRDVKPSNIMLTASGGVKIVDFGIASRIHALDAPTQELTSETLTAGTIGTPAYFAPECAQGAPASPAADLYALGVVLYQMLAGHLPFRAEEPLAMLLAHATAVPDPLPADVPRALAALCLHLLAKKPAERPASAAAVAAQLGNAAVSERTARYVPVSPSLLNARPVRSLAAGRHRRLMVTSAPLAVLLTTAAVLSLVAAQRPASDGTDHNPSRPPASSSSAPASRPAVLLAQTSGSSQRTTTRPSRTSAGKPAPTTPPASASSTPTGATTGSPTASGSATAAPSSPIASPSSDGAVPPSTEAPQSSASPSAYPQ
jgi:serine/threonine protein kinase